MSKEQEYYSHTCKCGCGGKIKVLKQHKYRGIPRFLHGHCIKKYHSEEERKEARMRYYYEVEVERNKCRKLRCMTLNNVSQRDYEKEMAELDADKDILTLPKVLVDSFDWSYYNKKVKEKEDDFINKKKKEVTV